MSRGGGLLGVDGWREGNAYLSPGIAPDERELRFLGSRRQPGALSPIIEIPIQLSRVDQLGTLRVERVAPIEDVLRWFDLTDGPNIARDYEQHRDAVEESFARRRRDGPVVPDALLPLGATARVADGELTLMSIEDWRTVSVLRHHWTDRPPAPRTASAAPTLGLYSPVGAFLEIEDDAGNRSIAVPGGGGTVADGATFLHTVVPAIDSSTRSLSLRWPIENPLSEVELDLGPDPLLWHQRSR